MSHEGQTSGFSQPETGIVSPALPYKTLAQNTRMAYSCRTLAPTVAEALRTPFILSFPTPRPAPSMYRSPDAPRLAPTRASREFQSSAYATATALGALALGVLYLSGTACIGILFMLVDGVPATTATERWLLLSGTVVSGGGTIYLLRAAVRAARRQVPGRTGAVLLATSSVVWAVLLWLHLSAT